MSEECNANKAASEGDDLNPNMKEVSEPVDISKPGSLHAKYKLFYKRNFQNVC
jgi:hypothetical protein